MLYSLGLRNLAGDISMKFDRKKTIPNMVVYLALYGAIFGISFWLLVFHNESPTNWILYIAMFASVLSGLVKIALHAHKKHQQSA
jgi:hypothetical protein